MNILVFNKYDYQIMAKLDIDIGTLGNPSTGDSLRTAFNKVNTNFTELYGVVGDPDSGLLTTNVTNGNIKVQPNGTGVVEIDSLQITDDDITSLLTNGTIAITGNGTGGVDIEGLSFKGTSISSGDSSTINLNENVNVDGNLTVTGNFDLTGLAVGTLDVDNLNLNDNTISSDSNADINISPGGTGNVVFPGITVADNTITTSGSNANLELDAAGTGTVKVIGNLTLDDSDEIKLGDAGDLRIFHNGGHSIIREDGTGSLYLQSDNNVILSKDTSTEIMVKAIADGAVELYHNNVKKLNTGSHGVDIVDELHTEGATPHLTLKRTDNANIPTLRFKGSGGTIGASIDFQGTGGTSNELAFQIFDGSSIAERFRVTYTGAKVSGTLNIDDGVTITDNTIATSASNANLELSGNGSGGVTINGLAYPTSDGTVGQFLKTDGSGTLAFANLSLGDLSIIGSTISSPSNADITLDPSGTGSVAIDKAAITGGTITGISNLTVDHVQIKDNFIKTAASNADLEISANGSGSVVVNSADINFAGARITYGTATTTSSSAANIDTFLAATYRSAKYQVSIVDSTNTKFGIYELFVTHDGSNAYINAQGISDTGLDLATFSADINSGSVRVRVVPISDASTVFKFVRTVFTV